jgi:tetratricopeptide (TPR) repeat protein
MLMNSKLAGLVLSFICLGPCGAGTAPASQSAPPQRDVAKAIALDKEGVASILAKRFQQAKALFRQAIESDPSLVDAHENLALLLLLEGDDASAEFEARNLLVLDPRNYNGRLVAGVAAINQGQFYKGANVLAPLSVRAGDDPLVTEAYSVALQKTGNQAEASRLRAKLNHVLVEDQDAMLAGQIFRQAQLRNEAQGWLEAYVRRSDASANPDILYMLAGIYAEQRRNQEASGLYERVLKSSPDNVDALVELSELELQLNDKQDSLSHLYTAKTLSSRNTLSLLHFSQICMRRHMYVDARDALQQVVSASPENREAWYQLGLAQYRIGETDSAEKDFRAALYLDPADEWSRVALGAILMSTSRQETAESEFRRVLAADPQCGAAHYYLAEIERRRGEIAAARQQLEKAVLGALQDARPLAALGELQAEQGDVVAARKSLERAIALDPTSAAAHYHLASLLRSQGEKEEANKEMALFHKYHDQDKNEGIVGIVRQGQWDYAGFLPAN